MASVAHKDLTPETPLLRSVLDAYPAAAALLGGRGQILTVNRAWLEFGRENGLKADYQFEGRNYLEHAPERVKEGLVGVLDGSRESFTSEYACHSPDGKGWYQMSAVPVQTGAIIFHTDITETRDLRDQLRRAQRVDSLGTLAGGIAHDLNNVLAPILMASELLQEVPQDRDLIGTLQANAQRGADLVQQILTFARGSVGIRNSVDVAEVLRDIVDLITETFPKDIHLETQIDSQLYPVTGDPSQIYQMLLNLCLNARDAMLEGGSLTVAIQNVSLNVPSVALEAGDYLRICVGDTGSGIPNALIEKIFEPFFTTKESGKGTGLGLSTVAGIVKEMKGDIDATSEPGKGTRFTIHLPAARTIVGTEVRTNPPLTKASSQDPLPPGRGETILLVDDEKSLRRLGERILRKAGYQVLLATNGAEALETYKRKSDSVQLVITDMSMPVMGGKGLVKALHDLEPKLPIISASGSGSPGREALREVDVEGFLTKPFKIETLLTMVSRVLLGSPLAKRPLEKGRGCDTLLLVDDNEGLLKMMSRVLKSDGHQVLVARSGPEALKTLGAQPVHCLVSDLNLRGMSGRQLSLRVAELHPNLPMVLVSGGVYQRPDVLAKPFSLAALRRRVREALSGCPSSPAGNLEKLVDNKGHDSCNTQRA